MATIRKPISVGNSGDDESDIAYQFYNPTKRVPYTLQKLIVSAEAERASERTQRASDSEAATCQKSHKGTQEKNCCIVKYLPEVDFRPKWEEKRLKRSLAAGEYTAKDANDTPSSFGDEDREFSRHWSYLEYKARQRRASPPRLKKYSSPAPHHASVRRGVDFWVSENDVKVRIFNRTQTARHKNNSKRGDIRKFSAKSRNRLASHIVNLPKGSAEAFCTLTYPEEFPTDGVLVKYHLKLFRQWLKRKNIGAVWFLEFQKRGAPHFHMLLTKYISSVKVANAWHRITGVSDPKHLLWHLGALGNRPCVEILRNQSGFQKYATKYALKPAQKDVPDNYQNVGRFWGYFNLKPVWKLVRGFGRHSASVAMSMVMLWRDEIFGGSVKSEAIEKLNYSTTLRGGASVFDAMLRGLEWTPF